MSDTIEIQSTPDLETKTLIKEFIKLNPEETYHFLAGRGEGYKIMQRVRSEIARLRGRLKAQGKRMRHFRLLSPIEPFEVNGIIHDLVKVKMVQSIGNQLDELLDDLSIDEGEDK